MNYEETKEHLSRYLKARIPIIIVNSLEKPRVIRMLKELDKDNSYNFNLFSLSSGVSNLKDNTVVSEEKTIMGALDYICDVIKYKENCNYILSDVADISDATVVSRYLLDVVEKAESKSGSIIIITNDMVWNNLARLGITISLNYPNSEELVSIIEDSISPYRNQVSIEWDKEDYKKCASYLLGLSEMESRNIISSFLVKGSITKNDLDDIKYAKRDLFTQIAGLESIEVPSDFQIAGLDNLREWLFEKKTLLDPSMREELSSRGIEPPRGILLTGVPGCGKSLCSKATSSIFNIPLYRLDLATVQGQYVGQSERQLKEALDMAEYFSPCVLWIDEIEKGLKDSESGNVTSKMIGQFLFWLQECKKPVFVIASANDVSKLPAELIRKGRFDEIFFVDLPNSNERKELFDLYFRKYLKIEANQEFLNELVGISEGFASADIEASIRNIAYKIIADNNVKLSEDMIFNELKSVVSIYKTNPEKVDQIRKWGQERAKAASRRS